MSEKQTDLRKVQALQGERSLTIVLPKEFAHELGIEKGDWLKVTMADKRLLLEKLIFVNQIESGGYTN